MKYCQMLLIPCVAIAVLSVICGCAILGQKGDKSVYSFEYPEVPDDYPFKTPIWRQSKTELAHTSPEQLEELILLDMVMVKLWAEGNHDFTGGVISNINFYPLYPDVAYVEWSQYEEPDGTIYRYASNVLTGGPNDSSKVMDQLTNGEVPEGIRIVDYKSAGIDPYEFLSK